MTNITYNKDATINIYVANLAEYTKGKLVGSWVSLPIEENDWKDFLKTIGNPEEIAIHDFDNNIGLDGLKIGEYESIDKLNALAESLENIVAYDEIDVVNALYEALGDFEEALECWGIGNYFFWGNRTIEEVAQEYIEETYEIPEYLENYIDYKAIARDLLFGGCYETDYGVIEIF